MGKKINGADQSTKAKIIDKAFYLFSRKGIKNTSMREIAAACGVTKPVIYYYFEDKDALCEQMVNHMKELQRSKLRQLERENLPFEKFIQKLFAGYLANAANRSTIGFMLHLHSYMSSRPALDKKIHAADNDDAVEILKQTVAAEVKAGRLPANMQNILLHLIRANAIHIVLHPARHAAKIPKTYLEDITKAILRAVCYKGDK